jgi:threonine aldolase
MFCLSKGLACPVGSIVAGSKKFISKARRFRKMLGGGMRQAGIIASFGLIALESKWIERLEEDHKNAKLLAEGISSYSLPVNVHNPETNIIIVELMKKARISKIVTELGKEGILSFYISKEKIRFVTHYGISEDDIQYSIQKIGNVLKNFMKK